jgi:hypothetical protein
MTIELDTQDIQFNINPDDTTQALNQLVQMAKQQSDKIKQLDRRIKDLELIVLN